MRKADYETLARLIARERDEMARALVHAAEGSEAFAVAHARGAAVADLARDFSRCASVDPAQFLRACGLEPSRR